MKNLKIWVLYYDRTNEVIDVCYYGDDYFILYNNKEFRIYERIPSQSEDDEDGYMFNQLRFVKHVWEFNDLENLEDAMKSTIKDFVASL